MGYIFGNPPINTTTVQTTIVTVDATVDVAAGNYVGNISFKCAMDEVVNAGTAPGGNDLIDSLEIVANETRDSIINKTFDGPVTIYFSGIVAPTTIKIYKR